MEVASLMTVTGVVIEEVVVVPFLSAIEVVVALATVAVVLEMIVVIVMSALI